MNAISLPDSMMEFLQEQAVKEGFSSAADYLQSLVEEVQKKQLKKEIGNKLREALGETSFPMTQEHWEELKKQASGDSLTPGSL
jgi:Arc/MetJ-type ribon-helix-helix transcriptional regulator